MRQTIVGERSQSSLVLNDNDSHLKRQVFLSGIFLHCLFVGFKSGKAATAKLVLLVFELQIERSN